MTKAYQYLPFLADPKRVEEDARRQEALRAANTRARLSDEERQLANGSAIERAARQTLELVRAEREARTGRRTGNFRGAAKQEDAAETQARAQLAAGLAMQGRFKEAAEHHPDKKACAEYGKRQHALDRPDDETCGCAPQETEQNGVALEVPRQYVEGYFYSDRHKRAVAMVACAKCGDLNARPLSGALLDISRARGAGQQAGARRPSQPDAQVLRKQ
jgi:hypothetical protein